ncbi:MAG: TIGR02757 family protein [Deltaproteobacteria bacterium]|nr:TIGR02757 family protein [Deltaproteobacteria bacterium]
MVQPRSDRRRKDSAGTRAGPEKSGRVGNRGVPAEQGDSVGSSAALKKALSAAVAERGREFLPSDPLEFAHRFRSFKDREAAAFIAASFAFGNVTQIRSFLSRFFDALGPSPHKAIAGPLPLPERRIAGLYHRFISEGGVRRFLGCMRKAYLAHGNLESMFRKGMDGPCTDMREALARFLDGFRAAWGGALPRQRNFLFPDPRRGSACKRHNLFLRWMVRGGDGIDLGIWTALSTRDLVVPLDTHMIRMGRLLGLTRRVTPGWRMAEEITAAFRAVCPEDPVKFDFALTRIGILKECSPGRVEACAICAIKGVCARARLSGIGN